MGLKRLPYKNLKALIGKHLSRKEDPGTELLIKNLSAANKRGYLIKDDLETICRWKSPRAIWLIKQNSPQIIKSVSKNAFTTKSERAKIEL